MTVGLEREFATLNRPAVFRFENYSFLVRLSSFIWR